MTTIALPGLSVSLPSSWRRRGDPAPGVVVCARAPVLPPSGVRPEIVVATTTLDHDDVDAWRRDALAELADLLVDLAVEDDDTYDLDGHPVRYHRFAHRLGSADVLCDQWAWLVGGLAVTLTCSAAREDYPDWCDVFEAVAETVDLGPA